MVVVLPPVEADLLRFVDRADQKANPDGQELDFGQRYFDVARHHEALVEHPVEHFDQTRGSSVPLSQWRRHRFRILRKSIGRARFGGERVISAMVMPRVFAESILMAHKISAA